MRRLLVGLVICGFMLSGTLVGAMEQEVLYGFENGLQGWQIPDWAYEKPDYVQKSITQSQNFASEGTSSIEIDTDFTGGKWTGAIIEIMQYYDWSAYNKLSCDIYLPADAPTGLKAKMILTVGDSWKWVEMSKAVELKPGEWTTITADLTPGSIDWRRVQVDDAFRTDIRKIDIRIESNNQPTFKGPIYVDNIRVTQ